MQVILTGNETLFDIVSSSGTSPGRLDQVTVIRAAVVEAGTDKREVYDLTQAFGEDREVPHVLIHDGDVVYVPPIEGPDSFINPMTRPFYYDRVLFAI